MRYIIFLALFILFSCSSKVYKKVNESLDGDKKIPVIIKLNQGERGAFGLPVNLFDWDMRHYCVPNNQVIKDSIDTNIFIVLERKNDIIDFTFYNANQEIEGKFFIPPFQEIFYAKSFDPETFLVSELRPSKVYNA